jgi:hypothetical protein
MKTRHWLLGVVLGLNPIVLLHGQHEHHDPSQPKAAQVSLEVADDKAGQTLTARLGPLNLPAHSDHRTVAQPANQYLTIPFDGWLVAYHPRLSDAAGTTLPGRMLHHVAFWNVNRPDFLCPNKEEHVFGAGGEMNDWPVVPGFGYRVRRGDRIRISSMFHNPTGVSYPQVFLEVRIEYRPAGTPMKSIYPAWFDVTQCGDSDYDLKPGHSVTSATFKMDYSGILLGVGGHMHDYGRAMMLESVTRQSTIATLEARTDEQGRLLSMPIANFAGQGGVPLGKGEEIKVTATYDNVSGHAIPQGAMGMVVGYFLPASDEQLSQLHREPHP